MVPVNKVLIDIVSVAIALHRLEIVSRYFSERLLF